MAFSPQVVHHSDLEVAPPHTSPAPKYEPNDAYVEGQPHYEPVQRMVWGLQPIVFWLLMALGFVVLAAGIGGGVGGTLAVNNAKTECKKDNLNVCSAASTTTAIATATVTTTITGSQANAETATPTSDSVLSIPTTGRLPLDCPRIDNTNIRVTLNTVSLFEITCGQDVNNPWQDIIAIIAYSYTDCAKACASYNRNLGRIGCRAAVFNNDLAGSVTANYGTCFLKNSTEGKSASEWNTFAGMILQ